MLGMAGILRSGAVNPRFAYLEPAASHEQAAIDLSLSRAAYFRGLRAAAERVAEYLAARA